MNKENLKENSSEFDFGQILDKKGSQCLYAINNFEAFIDSSSKLPLSNKVIVNVNYIYEFIEQIRKNLPKEIEQSELVINEVQEIMADAEEKSENIIEEAKKKASYILDESRIIKEAKKKADEIINGAINNSNDIKADTVNYVMGMFNCIEDNLSSAASRMNDAKVSVKESVKDNNRKITA